MYTGVHVQTRPNQPAFIMAATGEAVTYAEFEARSNRLAHLLRGVGLKRLDHYSIFMENNARYLECCAAGERSGLYYTCINSYLTADELAYIVNNSESRVLIISRGEARGRDRSAEAVPERRGALVVDGPGDGAGDPQPRRGDRRLPATRRSPTNRSARRCSTRRARPAGRRASLRPLPEQPPAQALPAVRRSCTKLWRYREGMIYLSPAPLYHSAPQGAVGLTIRIGGTAIIMERFDPEQYLQLVEQYRVTHSQLVPTMFSRMLKLPDEVRARVRPVVAGESRPRRRAVPGPGQGADDRVVGADHHRVLRAPPRASASRRATARSGSPTRARSARCVLGELHMLDDDMQPVPNGEPGHDLVQDRRASSTTSTTRRRPPRRRSPDGTMTHGRRRRLRRRRRLPVPHRPQDVHDHLRRRQHLPAGDREPADHPPEGGRRGGVRRAQRRPRRGGQGRRPADARGGRPGRSSPTS